MRGKIARVGGVSYTPRGDAILNVQLSVPQDFLARKSMGNFDLLVTGEQAETLGQVLRVGNEVSVVGALHCRRYRNRQGTQQVELKVIVESLEEIKRGEMK